MAVKQQSHNSYIFRIMDRCMVRLVTAEDCPGFYIRVLRIETAWADSKVISAHVILYHISWLKLKNTNSFSFFLNFLLCNFWKCTALAVHILDSQMNCILLMNIQRSPSSAIQGVHSFCLALRWLWLYACGHSPPADAATGLQFLSKRFHWILWFEE